jgi:hypothetical protein
VQGLHAVCGADATIVLAGATYRLADIRIRHYGEIEKRILASRPNPLEAVKPQLAGLPEHLQKHLLSQAYDDLMRGPQASQDEMSQWLSTPEGTCFLLWLLLREHQPDISLEWCESVLDDDPAALEQVHARLDEAFGSPPGKRTSQVLETRGATKTAAFLGAASSVA